MTFIAPHPVLRAIGHRRCCRPLLTFTAVVCVVVAALIVPGRAAAPSYTLKVLIPGAPIHGANGLAFDAQDRLFVASVMGAELVVMDPRNGRILDRFGPAHGVEGPDDVVFGPDGSVYWTDLGAGEVGRMAPDGNVTKQFVGPGVNPIAFSATGRLFVAQAFFGDGLYELDPDLEAPPIVIFPNSGIPPFLNALNGMGFGPDGMLYAPQPFLGRIVRVDVDAKTLTPLPGGYAGTPVAVDFDSRGNLYAAIDGTGEIMRIDLENGEGTLVARAEEGLDNMAFDSLDRLFVSAAGSGAVYEILPSGRPRTVSRPGMIRPGGIAVLPDTHAGESLYVADLWRLARIDGLTGVLEDIDRQSFINGMIAPITASRDGSNIVLTSFIQGAVQVWNPETHAALEYYGDFALPMNAIRFQDDLVVAELVTGQVVRRDALTGERTLLAQGLFVPAGLAATNDDLWVGDWASGIVWRVVADGEVLTPPVLLTAGLQRPEGLAVDRDGTLLVVESAAGRLTRIDPLSGAKSIVASDLALGAAAPVGMPPMFIFNGVAVGNGGDIYVTGDVAGVVYRLMPTVR